MRDPQAMPRLDPVAVHPIRVLKMADETSSANGRKKSASRARGKKRAANVANKKPREPVDSCFVLMPFAAPFIDRRFGFGESVVHGTI
jgi:hypothetical protein